MSTGPPRRAPRAIRPSRERAPPRRGTEALLIEAHEDSLKRSGPLRPLRSEGSDRSSGRASASRLRGPLYMPSRSTLRSASSRATAADSRGAPRLGSARLTCATHMGCLDSPPLRLTFKNGRTRVPQHWRLTMHARTQRLFTAGLLAVAAISAQAASLTFTIEAPGVTTSPLAQSGSGYTALVENWNGLSCPGDFRAAVALSLQAGPGAHRSGRPGGRRHGPRWAHLRAGQTPPA